MGWYTFLIILYTVFVCYETVMVWESKADTGKYHPHHLFWLVVWSVLLTSRVIHGVGVVV